MVYSIRTKVALPSKKSFLGNRKKSTKTPIYPFELMSIGDSFLVKTGGLSGAARNTKTSTIRSNATLQNKAPNEKRFEVRIVKNGIGVWRTK